MGEKHMEKETRALRGKFAIVTVFTARHSRFLYGRSRKMRDGLRALREKIRDNDALHITSSKASAPTLAENSWKIRDSDGLQSTAFQASARTFAENARSSPRAP